MKFLVMSEREIKNYQENKPHIIISIRSPKYPIELGKIASQANCLDILWLDFHDLDGLHMPNSDIKVKLFTQEDAKNILNFINKYKNNINLVICQCEAGISRSAGVAGALSKIFNGEDAEIFNNYLPNMLVYRTILEVYYDKK